ncbi:MAG: DNA cytosine methyltransferase [Bacteroidota bacterium]
MNTEPKRPIAIDLFAGVGGMSLGFEQAGFDIIGAVEIDPIHAAAHRYNFPHCIVFPHSVRNLSGAQIREGAGIGDREVDLVIGGAPCQGFSLMGQRALDDPRNGLVKDFVRLVAELDAAYFVFENVKGLTVGKHRRFLGEIIEEFQKIGYNVLTEWKVLNAADYGVPQNRHRLILMGAKKGRPLPAYPSPITSPANQPTISDLPPGPNCFAAIGDLPEAEHFPELLAGDAVLTDQWAIPSNYAQEMKCQTRRDWHLGYRRNFDRAWLTASARTKHTAISRERFRNTPPGEVEPISRFFKLNRTGISNTLRAGTDSSRGAFTSPRPIHYAAARCITVREMARLHGFPDWFRFHVTKWHGARQIGNAVPPPLARAVGSAILAAIGTDLSPPETVVELGDSAWLRLNMAQAAKFFGIEVPIAKRNRKSGAKKRKQSEIKAPIQGVLFPEN